MILRILDLFKLHDPVRDKTPKKWIVVRGKNLTSCLKKLVNELEGRGISNTSLVRYMMQKFNISIASAERLVYFKKEWLPLIFMEEILTLLHKEEIRFELQEKIEFIKVSQPPVKILMAPKRLSIILCKIAGAHTADGTIHDCYFCINDRYKSNLVAFNDWLKEEFNLSAKINEVSENEWKICFHNKIFTRYLIKFFGFPSGCKQYTTKEPEIIKNAPIEFRKAFALGALTFEAGVGMKHEIEFCVVSKDFKDSIINILTLYNIRYKDMQRQSSGYWRFWSNTLTKEEVLKWIEFFEPNTEKWYKLKDYVEGFSRKVHSFDEALKMLGSVYPRQSSSKIVLKDVLLAIKEFKKIYRYELVDYLAKKNNLKSYGGKWAHSLKHYLNILKKANLISVKKEGFGKKKSFGTVIREVYVFNEDIDEWRVPER